MNFDVAAGLEADFLQELAQFSIPFFAICPGQFKHPRSTPTTPGCTVGLWQGLQTFRDFLRAELICCDMPHREKLMPGQHRIRFDGRTWVAGAFDAGNTSRPTGRGAMRE